MPAAAGILIYSGMSKNHIDRTSTLHSVCRLRGRANTPIKNDFVQKVELNDILRSMY